MTPANLWIAFVAVFAIVLCLALSFALKKKEIVTSLLPAQPPEEPEFRPPYTFFATKKGLSPEEVMAQKAEHLIDSTMAETYPANDPNTDDRLIWFLEHDRDNPHLKSMLKQMSASGQARLFEIWRKQDESVQSKKDACS